MSEIGLIAITAEDKLRCVMRELKMRQNVYPRRVAAGRMTQEQASHEITVMYSIVEDYKLFAEQDRLL